MRVNHVFLSGEFLTVFESQRPGFLHGTRWGIHHWKTKAHQYQLQLQFPMQPSRNGGLHVEIIMSVDQIFSQSRNRDEERLDQLSYSFILADEPETW